MANAGDSTTDPVKVNDATPIALTAVPIGGAITIATPLLDKVAAFLRRVMPAIEGDAIR